MENVHIITIDQLRSVNTSLASRIEQLGSHLKCQKSTTNTGYNIIVDMIDSKMYLSATNGFDVSSTIEVPVNNMNAIMSIVDG